MIQVERGTSMCWGGEGISGYAGMCDTHNYWHAYCHYYNEQLDVSIPYAVMDNYGALVPVPSA